MWSRRSLARGDCVDISPWQHLRLKEREEPGEVVTWFPGCLRRLEESEDSLVWSGCHPVHSVRSCVTVRRCWVCTWEDSAWRGLVLASAFYCRDPESWVGNGDVTVGDMTWRTGQWTLLGSFWGTKNVSDFSKAKERCFKLKSISLGEGSLRWGGNLVDLVQTFTLARLIYWTFKF